MLAACMRPYLSFPVVQAMGTPLWLAQITDASDEKSVSVAWYMTFANGRPVPRMDGKWSLACKCQPFHKFDKTYCRRTRGHGQWIDTVSPRTLHNPSAAADMLLRSFRSIAKQSRPSMCV